MPLLQRCLAFLRPHSPSHDVAQLYTQLVAESRQPELYTRYGVPDTLDGRFDMIVLHLFIAQQQAKARMEPAAFQNWSRQLAEIFFADMDRSLREMGVGDLGVGRRVQEMGQAYYGRLKAYDEAGADKEKLAAALHRNIFDAPGTAENQAADLAGYVLGKLALNHREG